MKEKILAGIKKEIQRNIKKQEHYMGQIQSSPYGVDDAALHNLVEYKVGCSILYKIRHELEKDGVTASQALETVLSSLREDLLSNKHRAASTSPFSNAINEVIRGVKSEWVLINTSMAQLLQEKENEE